jgi:hypothetical protein
LRNGKKRVFAGMAITTILPFWKLLKGLLQLSASGHVEEGSRKKQMEITVDKWGEDPW